jgi:hypothetical protein
MTGFDIPEDTRDREALLWNLALATGDEEVIAVVKSYVLGQSTQRTMAPPLSQEDFAAAVKEAAIPPGLPMSGTMGADPKETR